MKRIIPWIAVAVFVFFVGPTNVAAQDKDIKTLAAVFADALSKASKKTVAVVDFNDLQGNVTELGRYLAEQVSVALATSGKGIEVVDRMHLKALLQEHKLNSSGIIDPATARKLGQIAGVEILVTGTLTPFGDSVQLAVKALDTNSARIVSASTSDIAKTKAIEDLLNRGVASGISGVGGQAGAPAPGVSGGRPVGFLKEVEQIMFVIRSCKLAGNSVTCSLQITNKGKDRELELGTGSQSRIIDQSGEEYLVQGGRLGSRACRGCNVSNIVVNEVPIVGEISFGGVSSAISLISVLELQYYVTGMGRWSAIQFRGIPVAR